VWSPLALAPVGIIAVTFVQFERSVESLYLHHPANVAVPFDLLERYFFALSEEQRVAVTRKFYSDREPEARRSSRCRLTATGVFLWTKSVKFNHHDDERHLSNSIP
jgi:hypothetical protein